MAQTNVKVFPPVDEPLGSGGVDPFSAALEASRVPTLVVDASRAGHPIVRANRAFGELSGYTVEELAGRGYWLLGDPETDSPAAADVRQAVELRAAIDVEVAKRRKDGTLFWSALFISPLPDAGAGVPHYVFQHFDITARREAERALVREFGSEGMATRARATAHEFNNALTVIRANLEPLQQEATEPRTVTRLGRISQAVDHAAELARNLSLSARSLLARGERRATEILPHAREGETVLFVEGDADLRLQGASMLRELGYQVEPVAAADPALALLSAAARVDLLLSDADARCADGTGLAESARAIMPRLRVLYSAEAANSQRSDVVRKPFGVIGLARAVRDAIDGPGS